MKNAATTDGGSAFLNAEPNIVSSFNISAAGMNVTNRAYLQIGDVVRFHVDAATSNSGDQTRQQFWASR
jgi:hypothetical protein